MVAKPKVDYASWNQNIDFMKISKADPQNLIASGSCRPITDIEK